MSRASMCARDFTGVVRMRRYHLSVRVPASLPNDVPGVIDALRLADRVFDMDAADAVVWIRRAAALAQDAGHDERAIELALAASDLAAQLVGSTKLPTARQFDERAVTQDVDVSDIRKKTKGA